MMLLSFAILAIVGGALAFNAKNDKHFCTTITNAQASSGNFCTFNGAITTCPVAVFSKSVAGTPNFCYTTDVADGNFDCIVNGVTLDCLANTTRIVVD